MEICTGNTIYYSGGNTFTFSGLHIGADIRKVKNGFVVRSPGGEAGDSETHVFRDANELAAWVRKQYTPKPAKKSGRKAGR